MIIYLNENITQTITEGITDKTYHFCTIENCLNILHDNKLGCSMSTNRGDAYHKSKMFYLSTQRSKHPRLGFASNKSHKGDFPIARIELDGYLLKQDGFEGKPVDYWLSMGKQSDIGSTAPNVDQLGKNAKPEDILKAQQNNTNFEYEDRIFSDKPYIPLKYVSRIDILSHQGSEAVQQCIKYGEQDGINVNVYQDEKDFILQTENTSNAEVLNMTYGKGDYKLLDKNHNKIDYRLLFQVVGIYIFDEVWENYSDSKVKELVKQTLQKYDLIEAYPYFEEHMSDFYHYNMSGSNVRDNSFTLANNFDLRKMTNSSHGAEGEKILLLAQDTLRKYKVNSFSQLGNLFTQQEKEENKQKPTVDFVPCIKYYQDYEYSPEKFNIRRADKITLWEFINKDTFYENISRLVDDYESSQKYAEQYGWEMPEQKIFHKSKNNESFKKYLQHLTYNDNLSLYDGAKLLMKIFDNNLKEMNECIWVSIEPLDLTKEAYIQNENQISSMDNYGEDGIFDSLFVNWDEYCQLRQQMVNESKQPKKIYIHESKLSLLKEGLSQKIYHFTDLDVFENIAKSNKFRLSKTDAYSEGEDFNNGDVNDINSQINGNYQYYISFTRSPYSENGYSQWYGNNPEEFGTPVYNAMVRIEFDSEKFNQRKDKKAKPIDFFSKQFQTANDNLKFAKKKDNNVIIPKDNKNTSSKETQLNSLDYYKYSHDYETKHNLYYYGDEERNIKKNMHPTYVQNEDRFMTNSPDEIINGEGYIDNISTYIKRVDVILNDNSGQNIQTLQNIAQNTQLGKEGKINIHHNYKEFNKSHIKH